MAAIQSVIQNITIQRFNRTCTILDMPIEILMQIFYGALSSPNHIEIVRNLRLVCRTFNRIVNSMKEYTIIPGYTLKQSHDLNSVLSLINNDINKLPDNIRANFQLQLICILCQLNQVNEARSFISKIDKDESCCKAKSLIELFKIDPNLEIINEIETLIEVSKIPIPQGFIKALYQTNNIRKAKFYLKKITDPYRKVCFLIELFAINSKFVEINKIENIITHDIQDQDKRFEALIDFVIVLYKTNHLNEAKFFFEKIDHLFYRVSARIKLFNIDPKIVKIEEIKEDINRIFSSKTPIAPSPIPLDKILFDFFKGLYKIGKTDVADSIDTKIRSPYYKFMSQIERDIITLMQSNKIDQTEFHIHIKEDVNRVKAEIAFYKALSEKYKEQNNSYTKLFNRCIIV